MKNNVLIKLRCFFLFLGMRLKMFWASIVMPFKIAYGILKRCGQLIAIDKEPTSNWEKYIKRKDLENQDMLELRRSEFFSLKVKITGAFVRTTAPVMIVITLKKREKGIDEETIKTKQKEFMKSKDELFELLDSMRFYPEVPFRKDFEEKVSNWQFDDFKTSPEIEAWQKEFTEYIASLDII